MTPPPAASAAQRLRTAPARPARAPRPLRPVHPRRVSGPARRPPAGGAATVAAPRPLVVVVTDAVRALPGSLASQRLLDRLVASKAWIGFIAFALIGIVTLQLLLLELNTGIGRSLQRTDSLQRENAALSIANSELAAGDRVQAQSLALGMETAPPVSLRFLGVDPHSDLARAGAALATPVKPPETQSAEHASQGTEATTQPASPGGSETAASQGTQPGGSESTAAGSSSAAAASAEPSGEGSTATGAEAGGEEATSGSTPSG